MIRKEFQIELKDKYFKDPNLGVLKVFDSIEKKFNLGLKFKAQYEHYEQSDLDVAKKSLSKAGLIIRYIESSNKTSFKVKIRYHDNELATLAPLKPSPDFPSKEKLEYDIKPSYSILTRQTEVEISEFPKTVEDLLNYIPDLGKYPVITQNLGEKLEKQDELKIFEYSDFRIPEVEGTFGFQFSYENDNMTRVEFFMKSVTGENATDKVLLMTKIFNFIRKRFGIKPHTHEPIIDVYFEN